MITISKRNGIWEADVRGGLFAYNESLETVLQELIDSADEINNEEEE